MDENYKPIVIAPFFNQSDKFVFHRIDKKVYLRNASKDDLIAVLSKCDGRNNSESIARNSNLDLNYVKQILQKLDELEIICDSKYLGLFFNKISSNPQLFESSMPLEELKYYGDHYTTLKRGIVNNIKLDENSVLLSLQENRKSCRSFDTKKMLSKNQIGNILNYAYSLARHAVPSGGGIYPIRIFCVIAYDQIDISKGYYEYDARDCSLTLYDKDVDLEQLKYCYADEALAFGSSVQIVLCADLKSDCFKYSNRGYRLALIEVGQVAQNIVLYCSEQGIASCELGGFLDKKLSEELDIFGSSSPLLCIAIGYEGRNNSINYFTKLIEIESQIVGADKVVQSYGTHDFDAGASFWGAWARFGQNPKFVSGATGYSHFEAIYKAIVEAYERYRSSIYREDFFGIAQDSSYVDLNEIAPLDDEQRRRMGLIKYRNDSYIGWVKDISGRFYIPSEVVFYGFNKKDRVNYGSSSGVAAYSDYYHAKKKALAELIERDAIMRLWYEQLSPCKANPSIITLHAKKKTLFWKKNKRDVYVFDLQSEYLPVFLAIIVGDEYPTFVSGAAASFDSAESAINKALQEAEYNLLLALKKPCDSSPSLDDVRTPIDHGHFYQFKENSDKIKWLWENTEFSTNTYEHINKYEELINQLNVAFVDLSEENCNIKVVRAISKRLIPISFGYLRDFYLHPEVQRLNFNCRSRDIPHFFA